MQRKRAKRASVRSSTSPTRRTLLFLRAHGWTADVCEKWVPIPDHPAGGIHRDLHGYADIEAFRHWPEPCILHVQCTSGANAASRVTKILSEPRAGLFLRAGGRIEVWGWRRLKRPPPGHHPARQWFPRIVPVTLDMDAVDAAWQDFDPGGATSPPAHLT